MENLNSIHFKASEDLKIYVLDALIEFNQIKKTDQSTWHKIFPIFHINQFAMCLVIAELPEFKRCYEIIITHQHDEVIKDRKYHKIERKIQNLFKEIFPGLNKTVFFHMIPLKTMKEMSEDKNKIEILINLLKELDLFHDNYSETFQNNVIKFMNSKDLQKQLPIYSLNQLSVNIYMTNWDQIAIFHVVFEFKENDSMQDELTLDLSRKFESILEKLFKGSLKKKIAYQATYYNSLDIRNEILKVN